MIRWLFPAAAALALCAAAADAQSREDACFQVRDIHANRAGDSRTLYINVNGAEVWQATMREPCLNVGGDNLVVLRTMSVSDRICRPSDLDLTVRGLAARTHCRVQSLRRLSPAEARALPDAVRP